MSLQTIQYPDISLNLHLQTLKQLFVLTCLKTSLCFDYLQDTKKMVKMIQQQQDSDGNKTQMEVQTLSLKIYVTSMLEKSSQNFKNAHLFLLAQNAFFMSHQWVLLELWFLLSQEKMQISSHIQRCTLDLKLFLYVEEIMLLLDHILCQLRM